MWHLVAGTGQFKRRIVEVRRGRPLKLLHESGDKTAPIAYAAGLPQLIRGLREAYAQTLTGDDAAAAVKVHLNMVVDAILSHSGEGGLWAEEELVELLGKEEKYAVHVFGTASTRGFVNASHGIGEKNSYTIRWI